MNGIDNIVSKIAADTEAARTEILRKAEKQAESISSEILKSAEETARVKLEEAEKKSISISELSSSRCEHLRSQLLLGAKVELINETISAALEAVRNYPDEKYFGFLLEILGKNILPGNCVICFGSRDFGRITDDFRKKVNETASANGASVTFDDSPAGITDGFILKYGDIEINCTLDAFAECKKDELFELVNNILFRAVKENE